MEIKVGDYVRFKDKRGNTYIRQIKDLPQDIRYGAIKIDIEANYSDMLSPKNVIKSSPNIIDLIEVGDYVNGVMVTEIKDGKPFKEDYNDPYYSYYIDDIYSIVTKEQFSQIEYSLESQV